MTNRSFVAEFAILAQGLEAREIFTRLFWGYWLPCSHLSIFDGGLNFIQAVRVMKGGLEQVRQIAAVRGSLLWGRVLFVQEIAVSLTRRTIERLFLWLDSASRFWAEGGAWDRCCVHTLGAADFRGDLAVTPNRVRECFSPEAWTRLVTFRQKCDPTGLFYSYLTS